MTKILVIGGGIAGIEASLGASSFGAKVYLIEAQPSLGGRVAQLNLLYPKLDRALEVLLPEMDKAAREANVEILTYAEVVKASRSGRGFEVEVLKKARHVDLNKCDLCGKCAQVCPVDVPNEFDLGLSMRKAVYFPFSKAVPRAYVIDEASCLYFKDKSCKACLDACPREAIDLEEKSSELKFTVDAVIVAVGYDLYDAKLKAEYGFSIYTDVITGLQLERMLDPEGPTKGEVLIPSRRLRPSSIAIVLCVGSRDETALLYCCRVGCMAGLKHSLELKRKYGDNVEAYLCFNDVRAAGKGCEEFYREARRLGIVMVRGQPSEIRPLAQGLTLKVLDQATNKLIRLNVDLVVLETGIVPSSGCLKIARIFGLELGNDGFIAELDPKLNTWSTKTPGVFMAGSCQSPKDVAESVEQAKAAALATLTYAQKGG